MFSTLLILVVLAFATPVAVLFDGPLIQGIVAAIAAVSVAIVALQIRSGEAGFLSSAIRPFAMVAAAPAAWMLIQVLPIQDVLPVNPIWKSASAALGYSVAGTISIDPGTTLISLVRYASAVAIAFVAAGVAVDRRRAEWLLLALVGATTLTALIALASKTGAFTFLSASDSEHASSTAAVGAALGIIFATAAALLLLERGQMHGPGRYKAASSISPLLLTCLIALATCFVAVVFKGNSQIYYAVLCGLATFAVTIIIRRYNFGAWGVAAIISIALLLTVAAIALPAGTRSLGLTVSYAMKAPPPLAAVTQRILAETNWTGTGAGTFAAILPIYQGIDELDIGNVAPSAAAATVIEMGWPIFSLMSVAVIGLVFSLLRGALRRQRDSYFSMVGAGCLVAIALLSFSNTALLTTPISTIAAVVIGIAIAQRKSRSR